VCGGDVLAAGAEHSTALFRGTVEASGCLSGGAAFPPRTLLST
jgi:hypothetical protein